MKELKFKSLKPFLIVCLIAMLSIGCESPPEKTIDSINPNYEIASPEYSNLAVNALTELTNFQFDSEFQTISMISTVIGKK